MSLPTRASAAYPIPVLDEDFNLSFPEPSAAYARDTDPPRAGQEPSPAKPSCVEIHSLALSGATLFSLEQLLPDFAPGCYKVADLFGFVGAITNTYVAAGYVTSNAFLPEQDLSTGQLEIVVVESRVEAIELIENGAPRSIGEAAMPYMLGKVLNLRAVEQGLDQINGLRSKDATISFRPGAQPGWSVVEVTIASTPGWQLRSRVSNAESWQSTTTALFEDTFGLFETLSFAHKRNLETNGGREQSSEYAFDASVPLGDWTLGWSTKATRYLSFVDAAGQTLVTSGDTLANRFFVDRVLHRDQTSKTSIRATLRSESTANYINDILIGVSSRTVSVGSLELTHSNTWLGGPTVTRVGVHRGLPLFGAADDGGPFALFGKVDGDISYTLPLADGLNLSTMIAGQWSPDQLYTDEQFSISGVPGFSGSSHPGLTGETGLKARGELSYALPSAGEPVEALLGQLTIFAALESGWTFPGSSNGDATTNIGGAAVGLRATQGMLSGAVSWSQPLWAPDQFDQSGAFRFEAGITLSQF